MTSGLRSVVAGHGLRVGLPPRWEARLYRRDRPAGERPWVHPAGYGWPGESTNPVLHAANFALPPRRADFGSGAVERMGARHGFVALVEYDSEEAGSALFAAAGPPRPQVSDFAPNALQRRLPGQLGCQRFFTAAGRPFCLYVVLGSRAAAAELVADVHVLLDNLEVTSRWQ